ncbi:MAG: glycoside hydrolase family 88 protein [Mobilitalea sp.]
METNMNIAVLPQFIKEYLKHYQNYKDHWNYEDGCILIGCMQLYRVTRDIAYRDYIIRYMEDFINQDGTIQTFLTTEHNIDDINAGKVLFFLYEETGEERYRLAIEIIKGHLASHPRTRCGNFWHKDRYPNQIWLDGLYMAQPFYMAYETKYNHKENYQDIINQFENVKKYMYNSEKSLYYHAYDEAKIQKWADKTTGLSPNFWLRSMGWYLMALVDTIEEMSIEVFEHYKTLEALYKEAVKGILKYQDQNCKLFYQVIDKAEIEGNYVETSGSLMVAYSIMKACRMGILQKEKYQKTGEEILERLVEEKLIETDGRLHLSGICSVAGLGPKEERDGSIAYYLSEKVVNDDPKGVGALLMAYAEWLNIKGRTCTVE